MSPIGALDAGGDVRVGLGGQPQVVGGIADRGVAHVGLQDRQQRTDVLARGKPRPQVVDRECVSQVVDAGAVAPAAVGDAGLPQEPAEVPVHDLRHSMAVNNLRLWFAAGEDVGALLPVLQAYMGHSSIADTDYYLRLTAESYPHITARPFSVPSATLSRPLTPGTRDGD